MPSDLLGTDRRFKSTLGLQEKKMLGAPCLARLHASKALVPPLCPHAADPSNPRALPPRGLRPTGLELHPPHSLVRGGHPRAGLRLTPHDAHGRIVRHVPKATLRFALKACPWTPSHFSGDRNRLSASSPRSREYPTQLLDARGRCVDLSRAEPCVREAGLRVQAARD